MTELENLQIQYDLTKVSWQELHAQCDCLFERMTQIKEKIDEICDHDLIVKEVTKYYNEHPSDLI